MGIELQKFLNTQPHQYAQVKTEDSGNIILKTKPLPHGLDVRHLATPGWKREHTERNAQTVALFIGALQTEFSADIAKTVALTHFEGSEKSNPLSHTKIQLAVTMARALKSATLVANEVTLQNFMESGMPALLQERNHPEWTQPAPFNQLQAMLQSHIGELGLHKLHPKDMPALAAEVIAKAEDLPETCIKNLQSLGVYIQSLDSGRTLQVLGELSTHLGMQAQFDLGSRGPLGADDQIQYQKQRLQTLLNGLPTSEQIRLRDNLHVSPTCKELCSMLGSFETKANVQEHIAESGELQDRQAQMLTSVFGTQALVMSLQEALGEMLDGKDSSARLQDWNQSVMGEAAHGSPQHCDPDFVAAFSRQLADQAQMRASVYGLSSPPATGMTRRYLSISDNTQLQQGLDESARQAETAAPSRQFDLDFHRGTYVVDGKRLDPTTDHESVPALLRPFATQSTLASALLSLNEEHGMIYGVDHQESRFYMSTMQDGSYLLTCRQEMSPSMVTTGGLDDMQTRALDPALSRAIFEINLHIGMEEGRCFARPTAPVVIDCRHYFQEADQA